MRTGPSADVFLYDRTTTLLTIVSLNDDGVQANGSSTGPSVSSDGMLVLFASAASNLVADPFTSTTQLYLRNYAANAAPVLPAFGRDYPLFEGQPLRLLWEFSDDDASTSWTATVDYGDGAGAQRLPLNDDKTFALSHLYAPGAYDLTVEVTDDAGATGSLVIHVVVTNVAPTIGLPRHDRSRVHAHARDHRHVHRSRNGRALLRLRQLRRRHRDGAARARPARRAAVLGGLVHAAPHLPPRRHLHRGRCRLGQQRRLDQSVHGREGRRVHLPVVRSGRLVLHRRPQPAGEVHRARSRRLIRPRSHRHGGRRRRIGHGRGRPLRLR